MASCRMPEEFFDIVTHHLPPDKPWVLMAVVRGPRTAPS